MTSPIRPFKYLPGLINGIQQRMMSSGLPKGKRPPLTPERIEELKKLVEESFKGSRERLTRDYTKYVSPGLDACSPYEKFKKDLAESLDSEVTKEIPPPEKDK